MAEPSPTGQQRIIVFGLEPDVLRTLLPELTADSRVSAAELQFNLAGEPDRILVTLRGSAPADVDQLQAELACVHPAVKVERNTPFHFSQT